MADTDRLFAGSIPDIYDGYLVPLIFQPYADDMAARVAAALPARVLETAAGSGVVTRALAPLLAANAHYTVTDLNQPMLDRAMRQQPPDVRLTWQQADAMALPFEGGSFDVVCCQFGVMFFPDRVAGYAEARRVLRPGGLFLFNAWDRIEDNEMPDTVVAALAEVFPDDPPRFLARTPHGYHDTGRIAADVRAAGFSNVEVHTLTFDSVAPSPRHAAIAFCQGTPMRSEIEARDASRLEEATAHTEAALAKRFGTGEIHGKIRGHVAVATS